MKLLIRLMLLLCVFGFISGCGGSGGTGGGGDIPSKLDIIEHAPVHGKGQGFSQLSGFVQGNPAFVSYIDSTHWTVSAVGESSVDLSTVAYSDAYLIAFGKDIIVGGYDGGTFAYRLNSGTWVAASFPGLVDPVLDSEKGLLIGQVMGGYSVANVATGTQTSITLPAGAALFFAKADWLVYGNGGAFFVRNLETNAEWQEGTNPGDTGQFPYAVNEAGGVVGSSGDGSTGRAVYWEPTTGSAHVIDSYPGGTVEPGWISPDGTKFIVNVFTDVFRSYVYVDGTKYTVSDFEGGSSVSYLFGFDSDGKLGFGFIDPSGDPDSAVAVKITYR